ncbi:acylphosphatase [Dokdonella koreensis]|uniref:Acylphosphatase n=1 Tax=Dokdonella koreensis DS-123 TaxID=1300342 RepID=A0A160DWM4_9GAMM|nr:acylphosphatase [Dokdonella koreensis]ANB18660.1 Acylphosphatase [Dokdonella koreensis DS-123]
MPVVRYLVSGRVQGVGFRAATRAQALRLRLDGYARNRADGRVEVLAAGPDAALAALEAWLQRGPPAARVDAVQREDCDTPAPDGFVIR